MDPPTQKSSRTRGVVGLDINADHLALVETDHLGNPINHLCLPLCTYGKSRDQAQAIIGQAAKAVVTYAAKVKKSLALEDLNFTAKKQELALIPNASYNRMLSSFSYSTTLAMIESRGYREGIEVLLVNPAFTSVMGRVNRHK